MQIWVLIHYSAFTSSHCCCLKCATSSRSSANKGHRMKGKLNMNVRRRLKWRGFTCTSQRWPSGNAQSRALSSQQMVEVCNHPSVFLKCWKKILNYSETQLLLLPPPWKMFNFIWAFIYSTIWLVVHKAFILFFTVSGTSHPRQNSSLITEIWS